MTTFFELVPTITYRKALIVGSIVTVIGMYYLLKKSKFYFQFLRIFGGKLKWKINTVYVLCTAEKADYKNAFKCFAEKEMKCKVKWVTKQTKSDRYLLLCNVESRIPDDVRKVLQQLGLEGKKLQHNTMVVAMHGRKEDVSDFFEDDSLDFLRLTNIFYSGNFTIGYPENEKAKTDIESFLTNDKFV
nr:uncharacterized protein LOC117682780 [Crassostrea gigas]XP_034307258.1 uncharacterized protein LOC117682842 [Crassostrea gigas]